MQEGTYKLWDPSYLSEIVVRGAHSKVRTRRPADELDEGLRRRFAQIGARLSKVIAEGGDYESFRFAELYKREDELCLVFQPARADESAMSFVYLFPSSAAVHYSERAIYTGDVQQDVDNLRSVLDWSMELVAFLGCTFIEIGRDGFPLEMIPRDANELPDLVFRMIADVHTLCESSLDNVERTYRAAWFSKN